MAKMIYATNRKPVSAGHKNVFIDPKGKVFIMTDTTEGDVSDWTEVLIEGDQPSDPIIDPPADPEPQPEEGEPEDNPEVDPDGGMTPTEQALYDKYNDLKTGDENTAGQAGYLDGSNVEHVQVWQLRKLHGLLADAHRTASNSPPAQPGVNSAPTGSDKTVRFDV